MARKPQFGKREHRRTHGEIRTSPEVQALLRKLGVELNAELGTDYDAQVTVNNRTSPERTRARLGVYTYTYKGIRDNAKNDSLIRALARRIK